MVRFGPQARARRMVSSVGMRRDSISLQGASFGAQFRSGGHIVDNVFIDNNAAFYVDGVEVHRDTMARHVYAVGIRLRAFEERPHAEMVVEDLAFAGEPAFDLMGPANPMAGAVNDFQVVNGTPNGRVGLVVALDAATSQGVFRGYCTIGGWWGQGDVGAARVLAVWGCVAGATHFVGWTTCAVEGGWSGLAGAGWR